jgi:hypothetical protein
MQKSAGFTTANAVSSVLDVQSLVMDIRDQLCNRINIAFNHREL